MLRSAGDEITISGERNFNGWAGMGGKSNSRTSRRRTRVGLREGEMETTEIVEMTRSAGSL